MVRLARVLLAAFLVLACGRGQSLAPTPTLGLPAGCKAVRNEFEPKLFGFEQDQRALLGSLRSQGVVVVRYAVDHCNAELEILPNCRAAGSYTFAPTPATKTDYVSGGDQLWVELPLGAAELSSRYGQASTFRTDYTLAGISALAPGKAYAKTELEGDCDRATHVVARFYLGGFGMAAGDERSLKATASVFGLGGGGDSSSKVVTVSRDGSAEACARAIAQSTEQPGCSVPLQIGLMRFRDDASAATGTPSPGVPAASPSEAASSTSAGRPAVNGETLPAVPAFTRDHAANKKIDEAVNVHYLATDFDKAEAVLLGTIKACEDKVKVTVTKGKTALAAVRF